MPKFLKQLLLSSALLGAACCASSSASLISVFNDAGFLLFAIGLLGPLL